MGRMAPIRPNNRNNVGPSAVRGAKIQKQRKKHKVVLESAGNKDDDKLRVVVRNNRGHFKNAGTYTTQLSFHAEPPPGYTFIPAGNTQLTAAMKAFAKKGGHQIMAVSVCMYIPPRIVADRFRRHLMLNVTSFREKCTASAIISLPKLWLKSARITGYVSIVQDE